VSRCLRATGAALPARPAAHPTLPVITGDPRRELCLTIG
jgi:hypothetical protein